MSRGVGDKKGPPMSSYSNNAGPHVLLGAVVSGLLLRAIHQDRNDCLVDAPQRTALLRDLIHMLLALAHSTNDDGRGGQYNDLSLSRARGGTTGVVGTGAGATVQSDSVPVYKRDFEEAFLGESQDYYRSESASCLSQGAGLVGGGRDEPYATKNDGGGGGGGDSMDNDSSKPAARYSAMEYVRRA